MGHGIAQVVAMCGCEVVLYDKQKGVVEKALHLITTNLDKGIERGKVTAAQKAATLTNIRFTNNLESAVADVDLVIEAIPEQLVLKQDLFRQLDAQCSKHTFLASNTSSLSINSIASVTARQDRVIGLHFFNPVHVMKLLEIVITDNTSEQTLATMQNFAEKLGKDSIVVKDSPGFASSRLGVCIGLEAIRMLEQGVASAEDIDKAMTVGYAHPMGPLRLTDLVGLDVRLAIADALFLELNSEVFRAPQLLRDMVEQDKLGKKAGQGFYHWSES